MWVNEHFSFDCDLIGNYNKSFFFYNLNFIFFITDLITFTNLIPFIQYFFLSEIDNLINKTFIQYLNFQWFKFDKPRRMLFLFYFDLWMIFWIIILFFVILCNTTSTIHNNDKSREVCMSNFIFFLNERMLKSKRPSRKRKFKFNEPIRRVTKKLI